MSQQSLYSNTFRRGLFDFHAGEAVPEVVLDANAYVTACVKAGMQTITMMTKDAFGNSYYNTRIGHKNAKLEGDLLREVVSRAKQAELGVIAYYNVGLNSHVARENPDYRQRTADGEPILHAFDYYDILCMNSPYRDFVMGQLVEIAEGYDVAGFFFDITYVWEGCCHCEYCNRLYQATYGKAIPVSPQPGTEDMRQWQAFGRDIRYRFLRDTATRLKAIRPDLLIGWNHAGDPMFGQVEADRYADYFTSEFHPPHYKYGSLLARWKRSFDKPFELMMPSEMGSWGEWTVAPVETLKTTAAIAVANGGSISYGHVAYPSGQWGGKVPDAVMKVIDQANEQVQQMEPWLEGAASLPMTAVLHSIASKRMIEASALANSHDAASLQGIHRILTEGHIHFDIVNEEQLLQRIKQYELVIIPDQAYISEELAACIRSYVKEGGHLVSSYRTSLYDDKGLQHADFALADVLGVHYSNQSPYSVSYLYPIMKKLQAGLPDLPVLMKANGMTALRVVADAVAAQWAGSVDPAMEAKPHRHVYHQHAHPDHVTPYPSVVMNSYGKGKSLYFASPIEMSYWENGSPWLRKLYLNALKELLPAPSLQVEAPLSIEVNVMHQAEHNRTIIHLVNVREECAAGSKTFIEEVAPVFHVPIAIKHPGARVVYTAPNGEEVEFTQDQDYIRVIVPRVDIHTAIVIE